MVFIPLAWLLALNFFLYLSVQPSSNIVKAILVFLTIVFQIFYLLMLVGSVFDDLAYFAVSAFLVLELLVCSVYKLRNTSYKEFSVGLLVLLLLGWWQYHHGSVEGELTYLISDGGGMVRKLPYHLYRWSTYMSDVAYPWLIVFNVFISPFWGRRASNRNFWIKLIVDWVNLRRNRNASGH